MPARQELPSTLRRSGKEAQETWSKAHDSAVRTYGEGERAHRTAISALKHSFEKVGDHWEPKAKGRKGPSDRQAAKSAPAARRSSTSTAGGVDANAPKAHLYEVARRLDVKGRSSMRKAELVAAINRASSRKTAMSRGKS
jgi:ChaB/Rho termination factor, N-terminal domain